ncbi:MAG: hypothetical protein DRO88_07650 [Promethearchaeia archaeon]|nr:MAG: hypothetical protein DRO88_07650 [Candidatus Lokiarchaeia archaeon]
MSEDIKKEIRQLIMMVSSIRSQDQDHWESHTEFTNEVIDYIRKIEKNMNEDWGKINNSLNSLRKTVEESLDALLTGIKPDSIIETSKALQDIQNTMGKSIQAINLENIMRELKMLSGGQISLSGGKRKKGISSSYSIEEEEEEEEADDGLTKEERDQIISVYGYVPEHLKKKQKKKEKKEPHLLKPSDFFGS